jgi:tetratricopeptide (TPR) repeat protein
LLAASRAARIAYEVYRSVFQFVFLALLAFVPAAPAFQHSPNSLYERALRLEKEGQRAQAIAAYDDLLELAPDHINGLRHRALLLLESGKPEAAQRDLAAALVIQPNGAETWTVYGDCLLQLDRAGDAALAYRRAIEHGASNWLVYKSLGDALARANQPDAALEAYGKAIPLRLDNVALYMTRADLLVKLKRLRDAIDDYQRVTDFQPRNADAYYKRAMAWGELGDFAKAAVDLTNFLQLKPGDASGLAFRGAAYDSLGRQQEALADYGAALQVEPANSHVLLARAELLDRLGSHEQALKDRDAAIAADPANAYLWVARGATHYALGHRDQALADRSHAIEIARDNPMTWYSRAMLYARYEQYDQAEADAREALKRDPNYANAQRLLAEIAQLRQAGPAKPALPVRITVDRTAPAIPGTSRPLGNRTAPPSSLPGSMASSSPSQPAPAAQAAAPQAPAHAAKPASAPRQTTSVPKPERRSAPQTAGKIAPPHPTPALPDQPAPAASGMPSPVSKSLETKAKEPEGAGATSAAKPLGATPAEAADLQRRARKLLDEDDFAGAVKLLTRIVAGAPRNAQAWNALGYGLLRLNRNKEAITALNRAIAIDPRYENAYLNRSVAKRQAGDGHGAALDRIHAESLKAKHRK